MSATNSTYQISYDLPIEANQADHELLSRIFETATIVGECWEAAGHRNAVSHYVHLSPRSNSYKIGYVHRFICHLYHGLPLSHRTHHCHHMCGNKACCRPSHLRPLSVIEHHAATHAAGQYPHGDQASWSILTETQVIDYRLRYAKGETCQALAREAGVKKATLWNALHGVSFDHVPGAVKTNDRRDNRGERHKLARLKDSDIVTIYTAYWTGKLNTVELATLYEVSDETIRGVVQNKFWKHVKRPDVKIGRVRTSLRHYQIITRQEAA